MIARLRSALTVARNTLAGAAVRSEDGVVIRVDIPIRTVSEANAHEHWRIRHRRAKAQRELAALLCRSRGLPPSPPLTITLTRVAPRALDSDNLAGSQKHIRDGIADWLGIDDGDRRLTWLYEQRKGAGPLTEVTIASARAGAP